MNRTHLLSSIAIIAFTLGVIGCFRPKDDTPPNPKVAAGMVKTDARPAMALPVMGAAPSWQLKDLSGASLRSEQFRGKVLVVDFWATWCPPCVKEIPGYTELMRKYSNDGLVIVGVSLDQAGPGVVQAFAERYQMNYPVAMGDESIVAAFGGVALLPTTFLIDRTGQIRDRKEGYEPTELYEEKIRAVLQ